MNHIEQHLQNARETYKESIVTLVTLIYIKHNKVFPNWSEDEEISVENTELGSTGYISVEVSNTYDNSTSIERWSIEEYRVNVSGELFFWCNDTLEEIEWKDVATDELVTIYTRLYNYWEKIKTNK
jgi:hypothetical protein